MVAANPLWWRTRWPPFSDSIFQSSFRRSETKLPFDEVTFRRLCQQLERELHRDLTPDEVKALWLVQEVNPIPVLVERRKDDTDTLAAADRRSPAD